MLVPISSFITLHHISLRHSCERIRTTSMAKGSSWEANSRSFGQEISRLLWNQKVPALSQTNLVHIVKTYCCNIYFNIILQSTFRSLSGLFPSGFPTKMLQAFNMYPTRVTCPAHRTLLNLTALATFWWRVDVNKFLLV